MIKLIFTRVRETFTIEVENKIIVYKDKKFPTGFQFMPKDKDFKKIVLFSRNKIPKEIIQLVEESNSGKNLKEYQSVKNDEELIPIIIRDAKLKGAVFQKRI